MSSVLQPGPWARLAIVALLVGAAPAMGEKEVPFLSGRIIDQAGLLSEATEATLESRLAALEDETGVQVAVLTIPSLDGEILEDYSLRVAETWKLGRGSFDDGALLLIAREERKMRLEVGYGLEGTIPDAYARRILDNVMQPRFRTGDFDGGVTAAIDSIAGLIQGDASLPPPSAPPASMSDEGGGGILPLLFFIVPMGLFSLQALGAPGGAAWFTYFFLMPFWLVIPLTLLGVPLGFLPVILWIIGFPILRKLLGGPRPGGPPRTRTSSGPIFGPGGGWSSSRGGWGGGFGGGFSGGGGGFGGGGASGSW